MNETLLIIALILLSINTIILSWNTSKSSNKKLVKKLTRILGKKIKG
jgi:hypothetical protein